VVHSVTAIADKLGLEFALFHRKREGKAHDAPEKMELLVGDVRGKVCSLSFHVVHRFDWPCIDCDSGG
jgi:phosphoribosylpyrophosphate synthetase